MKFKKILNNLENIRLLLVVILTVVLSTVAQSCQVYPDRQAIDVANIVTPCQETVITIDLTVPQTLDDMAGAITVNDMTVTECAAEFNKNDQILKKSLTDAFGYEIIKYNQLNNPRTGRKY